MRHGFIKTAAGTPKIKVADCVHNADEILRLVKEMERHGAGTMALPDIPAGICSGRICFWRAPSGSCCGLPGRPLGWTR